MKKYILPCAPLVLTWTTFAIWAVLPLQGAEIEDPRRPAAISTTGVPKVPDELAERLKGYDNIRSADFAGWSPDGNGILVHTQFGNAVQVHRVYEPGGRREQITFFEEPVRGRFIRNAQDGALLLTSGRGGDENFQIYCFEPAQFKTTLLTDGKSRNLLGPLTRDGKKFAYGTTRRNGRDIDWYVADCRDPDKQELLFEGNGDAWSATDWSRDGSQLLMLKYLSATESYPAVFDVKTKQFTMLPKTPSESSEKTAADENSAEPEEVAYRDLQFAPDGKSVYLATDARGEFLELARVDLQTGEYTWLSSDIPWGVDSIKVRSSTGDVAFTVNENGRTSLYLLEKGEHRRRLDIPLGTVSGVRFSPDGKQLGFTLAKSNAPAEAYSLELATGELTRWTFSEIGGLDPEQFVEPEAIEFESFDGRKIPAWLYRPRHASADKPVPVVVQIHGGPESQYRPVFTSNIQAIVNDLGVAVVCPNVRGSAGYGKTYLKLDNREKREDAVKDIGALLDWIAEQPELDSKRVAVMGGSYGGFMTLASLVHYGDRFKAGIDSVGIANFITFMERTSAYRRDRRRIEYGDDRIPEMRALMEKFSPLNSAHKIKAALMVIHGKNDPRVPFFEAEQIAEKVKSNGNTVWTVFADNEGHGFGKRANRDYQRAVTMMFLKQQLGLE